MEKEARRPVVQRWRHPRQRCNVAVHVLRYVPLVELLVLRVHCAPACRASPLSYLSPTHESCGMPDHLHHATPQLYSMPRANILILRAMRVLMGPKPGVLMCFRVQGTLMNLAQLQDSEARVRGAVAHV